MAYFSSLTVYFKNILLIFSLLGYTYHILHFHQFFKHSFTTTTIEHIEQFFFVLIHYLSYEYVFIPLLIFLNVCVCVALALYG